MGRPWIFGRLGCGKAARTSSTVVGPDILVQRLYGSWSGAAQNGKAVNQNELACSANLRGEKLEQANLNERCERFEWSLVARLALERA